MYECVQVPISQLSLLPQLMLLMMLMMIMMDGWMRGERQGDMRDKGHF